MKTLVIAAHPKIEQSRVNKRWLAELRKLPDRMTVHELYKLYPDYAIHAGNEQELIAGHDRIVLQFPIQWYSAPALLKQWLDDVFTTSWLYGTGGKVIAGKELALAISIGGNEASYQAGGLIGYTISELIRPIQVFANQVGMVFLLPFAFYGAVKATEEQIEASALRYAEHLLSPDLNPVIMRRRMMEAAVRAD